MKLLYQVIDGQTEEVIGQYETSFYAYRRADKLDNDYGAVRYYVKRIEVACE